MLYKNIMCKITCVLYFVETSGDGLTFEADNSRYTKMISATAHDYSAFAAMCQG